MGGWLAETANDFGVGDDGDNMGSYVSGSGATPTTTSAADDARIEAENNRILTERANAQAAQQAAQVAAHQRSQDFVHNQPRNPYAGFLSGMMTPAAPAAQWGYSPGHGPVWQTPERTINRQATNATDANWKMTAQPAGSPWTGGNRF